MCTEFVSLFYLPVIPLRSFRLLRAPKDDQNLIFIHSRGYRIIEQLPIAWAQVLRVYAFIALYVFWLMFAFPKLQTGGGLIPENPSGGAMLLQVGLFTAVLLAPALLLFGFWKLIDFIRRGA